MDDVILRAAIDSETTLYVSPISPETYEEHFEQDTLGGGNGYFVMRSRKSGMFETLDILAKAPSFEAAGDLFDLIVNRHSVA
jgi:hypothetical protein